MKAFQEKFVPVYCTLYYFGGDRVIILNLHGGQLAIVHIISMHHFPVLKVRT